MHVVRHERRLVAHRFDAHGPQHVADLMWVGYQAGSAGRDGEARELRDGEHRALEMHVRVDEAGSEVLAPHVDHLSLWSDQGRTVADQQDVPTLDRDVRLVDLARDDVCLLYTSPSPRD